MIGRIISLAVNIRDIIRGQTIAQLRKKGAIIGENVKLLSSTIDVHTSCLVEIGDNVTITNAIIQAHDASTKLYLGYTKIAKTIIGSNVFIGMGSIILPGSCIGKDVIIGAGSVVRGLIPDNSVVIGNPAKVICTCEEYINKNRKKMEESQIYEKPISSMSIEEKKNLALEIGNSVAYEL